MGLDFNFFEAYGIDTNLVIIILCGMVILLFLICIINIASISKMKKKYNKFMEGSDGRNLEDSIIEKFAVLDGLIEETDSINKKIAAIDRRLKKAYQKYAVVKYDAFSEIGGKLSFVIVLLTDEDDGILLNSMHSSKEGCYTYAKTVVKGKVDNMLSSEEEEALKQAINFGK